jgi:ketosteroid isomerase-like protein
LGVSAREERLTLSQTQNKKTDMSKNLILFGLALFFFSSAFGQVDNTEKIKDNAWNTIKTINRHWAITENMDSLGLLIHPDMVIIFPDSNERMQGKSNIIESYSNYANYAQTISLIETDPLIQLYNENKTAIVTYYYDLEIKIPNGELQKFSGRDMYTLINEKGKWIAVAQQYSPMPKGL